ncbi:MAG: hypothetical protein AAF958_07505 [Planctomycetota bacterium]
MRRLRKLYRPRNIGSGHSINRRLFGGACVASVVASATGCGGKDEDTDTTTDDGTPEVVRSEVPLRVGIIGANFIGDSVAESLRIAWQSIGVSDLEIQAVDGDRSTAADEAAVLELAKQCDVLLSPNLMIADLSLTEAVDPPSGKVLDDLDKDWLPAIRSTLAKYGGKAIAMPVGSPRPVQLGPREIGGSSASGEDDRTSQLPQDTSPLPQTWEEYDAFVADTCQGKAAEPTAAGWAAWMFLLRLPRKTGQWLFDLQTTQALLADDEKVETLEQMKATVDRYVAGPRTPDSIWQSILAGSLRGGIGMPGTGEGDLSGAPNLALDAIPGDASQSMGLLDPLSPVCVITKWCRQSRLARTFASWISGGSGSESLRNLLPAATVVRSTASGEPSDYERELVRQLTKPRTLPTFRIRRGWDYYVALDTAIGRCLNDNADAATVLGEAAKQWDQWTESFDADTQQRALRRSTGLRA